MKKLFIVFWLFICVSASFSQIVYEPLDDDVYNYLHRLSQKGVIDFSDLFKPLPREYISDKLIEAEGKLNELTDMEKEELDYFEKEYWIERSEFGENAGPEEQSGLIKKDSLDRLRLFYYNGKYLKANASPILGYELSFPGKLRHTHTWNGLSLYGYLPANLGFSFDFRINNESEIGADRYKQFTPETGIIAIDNKTSFDYSRVKSLFSYDWGWGNIVAAKEFMEYGYAKSGNLVLSNKAPSFPYILFQLKPVDWINFIYFHGWLSSDIIDSVQVAEYRRDIYRSKYFAWHTLIIEPLKGFEISIGESIVYSDKLELAYLMPFMFFFLADDYVSGRQDKPGDANSQAFFSISSKDHIKNTHLYGTLFIDELTVKGLSGSLVPDNTGSIFESNRLQLGYTGGISIADLPANNLDVTLEYTKIYPYVYGHHTPAQTYTNSSYLMGHWIGHNGDIVHLEFNYRLLRGLQINVWGEYIRKGSSDYSLQYKKNAPGFLFGLRNNYKYFGLDVKYEIIHELNAVVKFRTNTVLSEKSAGLFRESNSNEFGFALYYGL